MKNIKSKDGNAVFIIIEKENKVEGFYLNGTQQVSTKKENTHKLFTDVDSANVYLKELKEVNEFYYNEEFKYWEFGVKPIKPIINKENEDYGEIDGDVK